jgi:predicted TPR repeat methyltransferase
VLSAAANALKPGGLVVFTVEKAADHVRAFTLEPSGRYSHAGEYVRHCVSGARLAVSCIEPVVLRRESGREVAGWMVAATKTG